MKDRKLPMNYNKKIYISAMADERLIELLESMNIELAKVGPIDGLHGALAYHPQSTYMEGKT